MYQQMNIFDYIQKPSESVQELPRTQFEQMFEKVKNPVMLCANCLCRYCANNVEEVWDKVKPEEIKEPCFNCDDCLVYTGDSKHWEHNKEKCMDFIISDYGAVQNRKRIKLV